jgi:glycosyltransferase involved in cell wall biosynthesis
VTPDVDALAHAPGDVGALASAVRALAIDPARRAALARAARANAERRFDRARLARELIAVYEAVRSGPWADDAARTTAIGSRPAEGR